MSKPPVSRFPIRCVVPHHESSSPAAVCRLPPHLVWLRHHLVTVEHNMLLLRTPIQTCFCHRPREESKRSFPFFSCIVVIHFSAGAAQNIVPRWPWWCWALGWAIHRDSFSSSFVGFLIEPGVVVLCFPLTWLCKVCWYSNNVNIIMLTSTPTPLPLSIHQTRCQTRSCDLLLFYFHRTRKTFF